MNRRVIFAANRGYALTSSRTTLIRRFLDADWEVVIGTADDEESRRLVAMGVNLEPLEIHRGGSVSPADFQAWRRLSAIYRHWQPALIHHFHAKPVILGSLAARRASPSSIVVNTITGLGMAFASGGLAARLSGLGYRRALRGTCRTIFQNRDDRNLFVSKGWVAEAQAVQITGSGVDTRKFHPAEREDHPADAPVVVMLARLLRQKGVPDFATIAAEIRGHYPQARFLLAGELEPGHPDAVESAWLERQQAIEYLGRLDDVRETLAKADIFLFPSVYREGVPRVVLEAAAMGLPSVAYDVPGVREAIRDGSTGFLVARHDVEQMTARLQQLIDDPALRLTMGRAARELMMTMFDARQIEDQYLQVYRDLGLSI